jgi:biotin-dependent carboxylase-like uncharacterized protein
MLEVIEPGVLATIQDLGRPDAAPLGVPRSGACDPLALAAANLLLGDDPGAPTIELTGGLPELLAHQDTVVAVAGADVGLRMGTGGAWLRPGTSALLRAGTALRATRTPRIGLRTYLALPSGVAVPHVLGSASTSLVGGFGGLGGRPLQPGDVVRAVDDARRTGAGHAWPGPGPASGVGRESGAVVLTVTDGPHAIDRAGSPRGLTADEWEVADASDRVGVRLRRSTTAPFPPLPVDRALASMRPDRALESFALTWGAIEVPPDGDPIIVMPDGPTVGGYPVPVVVTRVDLPRLGQLRPGDRVRLRHVAPSVARGRMLAAAAALDEARATLAVMRSVW